MTAPLLPWQVEATRWLLDPAAPDLLAINGGIGCGKSWWLAFALVTVARSRPGSTSALLSDSWPSLAGNNLQPLLALAGNHAQWRSADRELVFGNGSRIELRHYRLAEGARESTNPIEGRNYRGGLVVVDEAQKLPRTVLDHATGRTRGAVVGLDGREWQSRVILNGRPDAGDWWWQTAAEEQGGAVMRPKTAENPHNGPAYLERLRRLYTPTMFRCVTEGEPAPAEGGVFADWSEAPWPVGNILDGWRYDPARPVQIGVDFGRRSPAVVWVQQAVIDGETVDVLFDEWAGSEVLTPGMVAAILAPSATRWGGVTPYGAEPGRWRVDVAYADPAGNARNVQTGATDIGILRRQVGEATDPLGGGLGCQVVTTTAADRTSVSAGLMRVTGLVSPAAGPRRLVMTAELWRRGIEAPTKQRTLARSLLRYTWEHAERKSRGGTEAPETHHVDALRYWCIGARWGLQVIPGVSGAARQATVAPR